jgi:hypothetical protein
MKFTELLQVSYRDRTTSLMNWVSGNGILHKQPNKLWLAAVGGDSNIPVRLSCISTLEKVLTCSARFVCASDSCHC